MREWCQRALGSARADGPVAPSVHLLTTTWPITLQASYGVPTLHRSVAAAILSAALQRFECVVAATYGQVSLSGRILGAVLATRATHEPDKFFLRACTCADAANGHATVAKTTEAPFAARAS